MFRFSIDENKYEKPEESIPDLPENAKARDFLKTAPTKGLWMPLGVEVKVMQCWRCKAFGHRTGDKECPLYGVGNLLNDAVRQVQEDPMANFSVSNKHVTKRERLGLLKRLIEEIRQEAIDEEVENNKNEMKKSKHSDRHNNHQHYHKKSHKHHKKNNE